MLSNAEERRLLEIEILLRERDPEFVRQFDAGWTRPVAHPLPVRVMVAAAMALVVIGVVVGSLIAVVAGLGMLCVVVGLLVWHRARRRHAARGKP
jgi:hypothetical protein